MYVFPFSIEQQKKLKGNKNGTAGHQGGANGITHNGVVSAKQHMANGVARQDGQSHKEGSGKKSGGGGQKGQRGGNARTRGQLRREGRARHDS